MEASTFFHTRLARHNDWPNSALQHPSRLSYLIDLRRRYFNLEGQCNAHHHQLRFRREQLARLRQAAQLEPAKLGGKAVAAHRLQQSLASGSRCEIQQLSREIEYLEKSSAGIGQQMAITALEENRFIAQLEQVRLMPSSRLTDLLRPAAMAVAVLHRSPQSHHFLATDVDVDESDLVMVRYCPQYFAFGAFDLETATANKSIFDRLPLSFEGNRQPA
jgi:hypothetical protein